MFDLSEFDLPPDLDDAASIRDVRTAALTAASTARLTQQQQQPLSSGSGRGRPSPISPGNVSGWTHNEVAAAATASSSNWGSSFGSSVAGGSGGFGGLGGLGGLGSGSTGGFYGSAKKTK